MFYSVHLLCTDGGCESQVFGTHYQDACLLLLYLHSVPKGSPSSQPRIHKNGAARLSPAMALSKMRGPALCKSHRSVALTVTQAYARLLSIPASEKGVRSVPLAKFGNYEVRLAELSSVTSATDLPIWMELYDHRVRFSIDGYGCSDLEDAIPAAEDLLSQAQRLSKDDEPCDPEGEEE